MRKSSSRALLEYLALEHRRVVSDWRAVILLRRATEALPEHERRWDRAPLVTADVHSILARMVERSELQRAPNIHGLYVVTVPYAGTEPVTEDEILMEAHPYAALSYSSAFDFHGLSLDAPKVVHAMIPSGRRAGLRPADTTETEWRAVFAIAQVRLPKTINERPVQWHRAGDESFVGVEEYRPRGYPVNVTNVERTLVDGLRYPDCCGGMVSVLRAWADSRDVLAVGQVVQYVDTLNINLLRQRAGYVLEELGLGHTRLEDWRALAKRGGSSRLYVSSPYSPNYSERWSLSINGPTEPLRGATA